MSNSAVVHHGTAILEQISLSVARGQLVGVCGAVGAGKTSLLNAILGELKISQGQIRVNPALLATGFGYVAQEPWIMVGPALS